MLLAYNDFSSFNVFIIQQTSCGIIFTLTSCCISYLFAFFLFQNQLWMCLSQVFFLWRWRSIYWWYLSTFLHHYFHINKPKKNNLLTLIWVGFYGYVLNSGGEGGVKVRTMLETWNLVRIYTRIYAFRKYTFQYEGPLKSPDIYIFVSKNKCLLLMKHSA